MADQSTNQPADQPDSGNTPDFEDPVAVADWVSDPSVSQEESKNRINQADQQERGRPDGPRDAVTNAIAQTRARLGIGPSANQ